MSDDFEAACERMERVSAAVLQYGEKAESQIGDVEEQLAPFPSFIRGVILSEVTKGSGQDLQAWRGSIGALVTRIRDVRAMLVHIRDAGEVGATEEEQLAEARLAVLNDGPRLERLELFLREVPAKIERVPAMLLPSERRGEFLTNVEEQALALHAARVGLAELADAIGTMTGAGE